MAQASGRRFGFDVERAVYLTVLHRLFASDGDRAAERWRHDYIIPGAEGLELHHLYRAMEWLSEPLEEGESLPGVPRCTKGWIEEALFDRRLDYFSGVALVFFNTADARTLLSVVERMKRRFGVRELCIVADRGVISEETIRALESSDPPVRHILGARIRRQKEVRDGVLCSGGPWAEVHQARDSALDPSPLKVLEVEIEGRRYVVC